MRPSHAPRSRWFAVGAVSALVAGALCAAVSCATSDASPDDAKDASRPGDSATEPVDAGPDVADAGPETGCDAADPRCTVREATCDEVDWCRTPTVANPLHAFTAVWGSSKNDVWAVGSGGTIAHFDGTNWALTESGVRNTFFAVWGSGPNDVWAVSDSQVILHCSGFRGPQTTWEAVPTPLPVASSAYIDAIWGSSPTDIRIGGRAFDTKDPFTGRNTSGDRFISYPNPDGGPEAGLAWAPQTGSPYIRGIWGSSANDVWMVADNSVYVPHERGLTLHGTPTDGGPPETDAGYPLDPLTWTRVDSQSNVTLEGVWGSSASDVWAVGRLGTIRHITPADDRWQRVESPSQEDLHWVWGAGPSDVWAVGNGGTILHFDGRSFTKSTAQLPLGAKPSLRGIWGSSPNDVWIVGEGIVLHYTGPKAKPAPQGDGG
ncbi:MAG: hypothetical protein IPF92_17765 [Myxococcales bacterium]|nr:hypothetical protein [Myxococcales bacterium]